MSETTYAQERAFLRQRVEILELLCPGDARLLVAPGYQGRVMTSTAAGDEGCSFGWINKPFIEARKDDPRFNNYGGEDRFWLGPEAGQFGLWFAGGEPFDSEHWKTPPGFNTGPFEVTSQGSGAVAMTRRFDVRNYLSTTFHCAVERTITALDRRRVAEHLNVTLPAELSMVAFESNNTLTNAGDAAWTRRSGLLSIWILGQFKPLSRGCVIVPFKPGPQTPESPLGPKATTDYFGPVPPERCRVGEDHLLFSCDGKFRSKLGISPARTRDILGSYDPDGRFLTIVQFNLPAAPARLPYVNSLWEIQDDPFAGDVVNSYNDGPDPPGSTEQLGPFYEIETSSPAGELKSGESISHVHRTYHFTGGFDSMNDMAVAILGVDLKELRR